MDYQTYLSTDILTFVHMCEPLYDEITQYAARADSKKAIAELIADRYYQIIHAGLDDLSDLTDMLGIGDNVSAMLIREMCLELPFDVFIETAEWFWHE